MSNEWDTLLLAASWGDVEFHVTATRDDRNHAVASYAFPYRDGADTEDMGAEPRITRARLVFFETPTQPRPFQRLRRFEDLRATKKPYTFVHPLYGSFIARVPDYTMSAEADARGFYVVDCTFVEHSTLRAILVNGTDPVQGSVEEVDARAAALDDELLAATPKGGTPLTSTAGASALAKVTAWAEEPPALQELAFEVAAFQAEVQAELTRLECRTNIKRWGIYHALTGIAYSVRRYAETLKQNAPRLIELVVSAPMPLMVLVANLYGAGEASKRYEQILGLNSVPHPGRLEKGMVLQVEEPPAVRRRTRAA